jgi:aspartate aminotransferase
MMISERAESLGTESAFDVLAEVNRLRLQGRKIISFCIGQPDFDTPRNIKDAGIKAINDGKCGYTDSAGVYEVRESVAKHLSKTRNIDAKPEHIVIANGVKPFIAYAILCTTDYGRGHEVIYPNPGFPTYELQAIASGAVPVPLPLIERKKFSFDIEELKSRINENTRLLILNSPHNPTGGILNREDLEQVAQLAKKHGFWIFSDEIYSRLDYDLEFRSIASLPGMYERTIVCDGVSKSHAMTGWRMGYAANPILARKLERWVMHFESCANHMSQYALKEALDGPQKSVQDMTQSFRERRVLTVNLLNDIDGVNCLMPGGAFYVFPNVTRVLERLNLPDAEALRKLLLENGVAVLADTSFGAKDPNEKNHYIRMSYATSKEQIIEGVSKMKEVMENAR